LGQDGFYFDPAKVESIAKALENFSKISDNHKKTVQINLYNKAKQFTWEKVAKDVLEVLMNYSSA